MTKLKLFPKIFLSTLLLFISLIAIVHGCIFFLMPKVYADMKETESEQKMTALAQAVEGQSPESMKAIIEKYTQKNPVNVSLEINSQEIFFGNTMMIDFDSLDDRDNNLKIALPLSSQQSEYTILKSRVLKTDKLQPVKLNLMMDVSSIQEARQATMKTLPYTLAFSILCSLIFSYIYTRLTVRPIHEIVAVTDGMIHLNREERYPVNGQDEFNLLGQHINDLYESLLTTIDSLEEENEHIVQLEEERMTFLRAASHELKTPLTNLRLVIENMALNVGPYKDRDKYLNQSLVEIDKLYQMIQDILMSQDYIQNEQYLHEEEVSLKDLIQTCLQEYKILAESKHLSLVCELEDDSIWANRSLMEKVISNLLSNAFHYTDDGGKIEIRLKAGNLSIKNQCQPIPKEDLRKVYEPLYRLEQSRNSESGGSGMGLYLVKFFLDKKAYRYDFQPYDEGMNFTIQFHTGEESLPQAGESWIVNPGDV